jgi:hypothetical protein
MRPNLRPNKRIVVKGKFPYAMPFSGQTDGLWISGSTPLCRGEGCIPRIAKILCVVHSWTFETLNSVPMARGRRLLQQKRCLTHLPRCQEESLAKTRNSEFDLPGIVQRLRVGFANEASEVRPGSWRSSETLRSHRNEFPMTTCSTHPVAIWKGSWLRYANYLPWRKRYLIPAHGQETRTGNSRQPCIQSGIPGTYIGR